MIFELPEQFFIFFRKLIFVALQDDFCQQCIAFGNTVFAGAAGINSKVAGRIGEVAVMDSVERKTIWNNRSLAARSYTERQKCIRIKGR